MVAALRFEVATPALAATDTTGAGDAFDAGFLAAFTTTPPDARLRPAALRRAALAGHRAAARQLTGESSELPLG
jgi:sugar/nucleoside kinase (ribokinase family)